MAPELISTNSGFDDTQIWTAVCKTDFCLLTSRDTKCSQKRSQLWLHMCSDRDSKFY